MDVVLCKRHTLQEAQGNVLTYTKDWNYLTEKEKTLKLTKSKQLAYQDEKLTQETDKNFVL